VVYVQAINLDPDFATRIAGVSQGLAVRRTAPPGMVAIAPGSFRMGSSAANAAPYFNTSAHQPVHVVTLTQPFWMGQHEVTQAEYVAVIGTNPSFFPDPQRPVERVNWDEALAYCAALTAIETLAGNVPAGYEFRLPTEAEWEYACRAGTTTEFNVGAQLLCSDARFDYSWHSSTSCGSSSTTPVGTFAPNAWGLYDMHGNVREWCLDGYTPYNSGSVTDPFVSNSQTRSVRGGQWGLLSDLCRSASRVGMLPWTAFNNVGFRVVLGPIRQP